MNSREIRMLSLATAQDLGYPTNDELPLLDDVRIVRTLSETVERALCVYVAVAVAYGLDRTRAAEWSRSENIDQSLTANELAVLRGMPGAVEVMKKRVEALYVFAWSMGFLVDIDFRSVCPPTLVQIFPNLKVGRDSAEFRQRATLVADEDVAKKLDLAYCLHWATVETRLASRKSDVLAPSVIIERRRALEWLVSNEDFEEISLDT